MKVSDMNAITQAVRAADRATGTQIDNCRMAADLLAEKRDGKAKTADEYKRLMTEAKKIVKDDDYEVLHKNIWSNIANFLLVRLEPDYKVEEQVSGKKQKRLVAASDTDSSIKRVQKAAKQIREACGMADKRSTNAPKATKPQPRKVSAASIKSSEYKALIKYVLSHKEKREAFELAFLELGYTVTIEKKAATPPAKPKRKPRGKTARQS